MTRPVLFVSGPYRAKTLDGVLANILRAREAAKGVWQAGAVALCPHTNTALMDGACSDDVWLEGDIELLRRCDGIVLVEGWSSSDGTLAEREVALTMRLPIFEWPVHRERITNFASAYQDDSDISDTDD